jgi:N-acetylglucosaminyldiphosphoundecaprenol N-acetyl-beta-D-mannosaminyltransferase
MNIALFQFLGIRLHAMTKQDLVDAVVQAVSDRRRCVIGNHNLHSLYFWTHESKMRDFYSLTDYVHIDGMPLVWLGRLFGYPFKSEHRTGYITLLPLLAEEALKRQWRIFYLGSRPSVAEISVRELRHRYPGLQIVARHGYFDATPSGKDNQGVLAEIREYAPDVLLVGMGMPRQEIWIQENLNDIAATAILCCGGLMDLIAGELPLAPPWLGPLGLEWVFRFCSNPVRYWRRYLLEPWFIVFRVAKYYLRRGHFGIPVDTK